MSKIEYLEQLKKRGLISLTPDETRAALKTHRVRSHTKKSWFPCRQAEIFYNGKWIFLGRCDLAEQVHSGFCLKPRVNAKKYYLDLIRHGAIIKDDAFYVVDSRTDG